MTAWQTETLFSSHYKVSLSLFSSGNCSRDSIKVNDITCMCSISAGTGSEYITLRKREDGLGLSSPVFTHMLYYRVRLNHITVYNSSHSGPPFCFPFVPSAPGRSPRGNACCHPSHLRGALQPDNPAACCPSGAEGAAGGGERRDTYRPEE